MSRGVVSEIDHLVYLAPDVDAAVDDIERRLGVRPAPGGRHARWGTRNALIALGSRSYFEILGPDPERSDRRRRPGFGLDGMSGPRLALWAIATDDLEARSEAAGRRGVRQGEVSGGSRERPDGSTISWRLTDPETVLGDGLVPFLIDWGDSEHPATDAPSGCILLGLRGEHPDPERIRRMLEAVGAPIPVARGDTPRLIATIRSPLGEVELS